MSNKNDEKLNSSVVNYVRATMVCEPIAIKLNSKVNFSKIDINDLNFVNDILPNGKEAEVVKRRLTQFLGIKPQGGGEKTLNITLYSGTDLQPFETELIDTPEMQRLRGIKQLGAVYLVYPDAKHDRFSHSIGVNFLANWFMRSAKFVDNGNIVGNPRDYIDKQYEEILKVSTLIHDVGHPPFGHIIEKYVIEPHFNLSHEDMSQFLILNSNIQDVLQAYDIEPSIVADIFDKEKRLDGELNPIRDLVSSSLDLDKMDYLIRDAQNTGVPLGICDVHRIISTLVIYKEDDQFELALLDKGLRAMESLVMAREWMFLSVYNHRTVNIVENMLARATYEKISSEKWKKDEAIGYLLTMNDSDLLNWLEDSDSLMSQDIVYRFKNRRLYKQLAEFPISIYSKTVKKEIKQLKSDINYRIQVENTFEDYGINRGEIIIDFSSVISNIVKELNALPICKKDPRNGIIISPKEAIDIEEARPFLQTLTDRRSAGETNSKILLYGPKEKEMLIKNAFLDRFPNIG